MSKAESGPEMSIAATTRPDLSKIGAAIELPPASMMPRLITWPRPTPSAILW
jgi:hypothetical protein